MADVSQAPAASGVDPIALAVPFFFVLIALELAIAKKRGVVVYRFADTVTDLSCGITQQVVQLFCAAMQLAIYAWVFEHGKLFTLPTAWLPWVLGFVGYDFFYYWWHRLSHEVNLLWGAHVVHHSSEDYNLSVALRQGAITSWTELPFMLPLALVGVPPVPFALGKALSTLYQFWIHTQLVKPIGGPIDKVLNLPSHHRVHHAINPQYLDKNYAGVFILWDRMFGTFAPEVAPCVYGITKPLGCFNPIWAQMHYWFELVAMTRAAKGPREKLWVWFASPAWKPKGYVVETPPIEARIKYDVLVSRSTIAWVVLNYVAVVAVTFSLLMWHARLPLPVLLLAGAAVVGALVAIGARLEGRSWAKVAEVVRFGVAAAAIVAWIKA